MQTTEILRTEVKFRFIDYLKAAQIPYYEPALTVCPHCGQHAQVVGDFLWNCPSCGSKRDVVDYAMESHGFRKTDDALKHVCRVLGVKICRAVRTLRHPLLRAVGGKCEVSDSGMGVRYFRYVRYFRHPTRCLIIAPSAHTAQKRLRRIIRRSCAAANFTK